MKKIRYKYPRTPHLPWSPGATKDDRILPNINHFINKEVVITEKMDGENTSLYKDGLHARSIDSAYHPSRDWLKNFHSQISYLLNDYRICGEYMYAKHSIFYNNLTSYFYGFSVWKEDLCLDWEFTTKFFSNLNIPVPQILYDGIYSKDIRINLDEEKQEGYVIRLKDSFLIKDFNISVAKYVRPHHIQTDNHWMHSSIIKNLLASS